MKNKQMMKIAAVFVSAVMVAGSLFGGIGAKQTMADNDFITDEQIETQGYEDETVLYGSDFEDEQVQPAGSGPDVPIPVVYEESNQEPSAAAGTPTPSPAPAVKGAAFSSDDFTDEDEDDGDGDDNGDEDEEDNDYDEDDDPDSDYDGDEDYDEEDYYVVEDEDSFTVMGTYVASLTEGKEEEQIEYEITLILNEGRYILGVRTIVDAMDYDDTQVTRGSYTEDNGKLTFKDRKNRIKTGIVNEQNDTVTVSGLFSEFNTKDLRLVFEMESDATDDFYEMDDLSSIRNIDLTQTDLQGLKAGLYALTSKGYDSSAIIKPAVNIIFNLEQGSFTVLNGSGNVRGKGVFSYDDELDEYVMTFIEDDESSEDEDEEGEDAVSNKAQAPEKNNTADTVIVQKDGSAKNPGTDPEESQESNDPAAAGTDQSGFNKTDFIDDPAQDTPDPLAHNDDIETAGQNPVLSDGSKQLSAASDFIDDPGQDFIDGSEENGADNISSIEPAFASGNPDFETVEAANASVYAANDTGINPEAGATDDTAISTLRPGNDDNVTDDEDENDEEENVGNDFLTSTFTASANGISFTTPLMVGDGLINTVDKNGEFLSYTADYTGAISSDLLGAYYRFTEGANGSIAEGSNEDYLLMVEDVNGGGDEYDKFTSFTIDGEEMDENDYDVQEGSLILIVNGDYMEGLSVGTYEITVSFTDGSVSTNLTVRGAGESATATPSASSYTPVPTRTTTTPAKTGDPVSDTLYLWLILAASAAIFLFVRKAK